MILTAEERLRLSEESSHGLDDFEFIGIIEAAVIAKLQKQEHVAELDDAGIIVVCSGNYKPGGRLYNHPSTDAMDAYLNAKYAMRKLLDVKV